METVFKIMREKAGLKQSEVANKLNIAQSTVSMWETGDSFPSRMKLKEIANYFGVTTDYLLGRSHSERDSPGTTIPAERNQSPPQVSNGVRV